MATLLDDEQQPEMELQQDEILSDISEENPADQVESVEEPTAEEEVSTGDNPDRFAGRSHDELLEMVREQDRRIGQQGNELGNLRSTFEALSKAQSVPEPEPEPVEEADETLVLQA